MANKPFDREVWHPLERPKSGDNNQEATYADLEVREIARRRLDVRQTIATDAATVQPAAGGAAFIGAGYRVRAQSPVAMQVKLDAGLGWYNDNATQLAIGGFTGVNDVSVIKPMTLTADETINVPASDPSNPRIDIIEVRYVAQVTDLTSTDVLTPASGTFGATSIAKTLSYNQNGLSTVNGTGPINYKTGTPAGTPVAPAVDTGYVKIAEVRVNAAAAAVGVTNVRDTRLLAAPSGQLHFAARVVASLGGASAPAVVTRLSAPPGMIVGARALQIADSRTPFNLMVVAGGCPSAYGTPILSVTVEDGPGNTAWVPTLRTIGGFSVVGASAGSLSNPTKSSPLVTLGEGQSAWETTIGTFNINNTTGSVVGFSGFAAGVTMAFNVVGVIPVNPT